MTADETPAFITIELSRSDAFALADLLNDSPHDDGCTEQTNPQLCINCRAWNLLNSALEYADWVAP